jgi:toxin ParE1/3/4
VSRKLIIKPAATKDMQELVDYIAERNYDAAVRLGRAMQETLNRLLQFPGLGRVRDYRNPRLKGMRMRPTDGFSNYLIFYLPSDDIIEVVRVLHAARDIESLFHDDNR